VLREKHCCLVADGWFVLREKYCWLVVDKPNEQGVHALQFGTLCCAVDSMLLSHVSRVTTNRCRLRARLSWCHTRHRVVRNPAGAGDAQDRLDHMQRGYHVTEHVQVTSTRHDAAWDGVTHAWL
jgi:hypothetical protein